MLTLDDYIIIKLLTSNYKHIMMGAFFISSIFSLLFVYLVKFWLESHFCFQQPSKMKGKVNSLHMMFT